MPRQSLGAHILGRVQEGGDPARIEQAYVTNITSGVITVNLRGVSLIAADSTVSCLVGDTVLVARAAGVTHILGVTAAGSGPPVVVGPPPGQGGGGGPITLPFNATQAATYRSGTWRDDADGDVVQGTAPGFPGLNSGGWWYGNRPAANLAGRTVVAAKIWLGRVFPGGNYGPQTVHLYRETHPTRPPGAPAFDTSVTAAVALTITGAGSEQTGWFPLPLALAQNLVDHGGGIGVSSSSGPYVRLFGINKSSSAGALSISCS